MCGRYGLFHEASEIATSFGADIARLDPPLRPRYNLAPTQGAPIVLSRDGEGRVALTARWGLIPHWVRDPATFRATLINARSESAHAKPSFRDAFRDARCLVPASGFYEWSPSEAGGPKRPWFVRRRDGSLLALAGLYASRPEGTSFTIVTTRPNALLERIHDRQPVIVPQGALDAWLDPARRDAAALSDLLEPSDPDALEVVPVSTRVNAPRNDAPDLIVAVGTPLTT
ncbi:MAG: SOS response-associated peptidase [Trueperaceae bacterium]